MKKTYLLLLFTVLFVSISGSVMAGQITVCDPQEAGMSTEGLKHKSNTAQRKKKRTASSHRNSRPTARN